jgi:uncharacterized SAM-binding protein YcdF (DUF218 family)
MFLLKKLLTELILPPTGPILLVLLGIWLTRAKSRRWQHGGRWLAALSTVALLLLSLPVVGTALLASLETAPPISASELQKAQAIVILGGGSYYGAPEYGGDTVNSATLERLRYGARLARASGLPVLVSAGQPFGGRPEAESMKAVLEGEFGIKVRWIEVASRDTAENASLSVPILKAAGIGRIALVSHGWHLSRAAPLFEREGLVVAPAPTVFSVKGPSLIESLLPGEGLRRSRSALREYLGQLYNRLKGPP